jgi:hypothetical protein
MLSLLESDYPRDIIERQINDRLQKRLFKMWWESGDSDYWAALRILRVQHGWERIRSKARAFLEQPCPLGVLLHDR